MKKNVRQFFLGVHVQYASIMFHVPWLPPVGYVTFLPLWRGLILQPSCIPSKQANWQCRVSDKIMSSLKDKPNFLVVNWLQRAMFSSYCSLTRGYSMLFRTDEHMVHSGKPCRIGRRFMPSKAPMAKVSWILGDLWWFLPRPWAPAVFVPVMWGHNRSSKAVGSSITKVNGSHLLEHDHHMVSL